MAKFTLEEKRLQQLRTQLSGTGQKRASRSEVSKDLISPSPSHHHGNDVASTITADARFMRLDLLKIGLLTTIALLVQFGLYAAMISKLIPTF